MRLLLVAWEIVKDDAETWDVKLHALCLMVAAVAVNKAREIWSRVRGNRCRDCGCTDRHPCMFRVYPLDFDIMCDPAGGGRCSCCVGRILGGPEIGAVTRSPDSRQFLREFDEAIHDGDAIPIHRGPE